MSANCYQTRVEIDVSMIVESVGHMIPIDWSVDLNSSDHLPIAFPISVLADNGRIIHRWLNIPLGIDRVGDNRMFVGGRFIPVVVPNLPRMFGFLRGIKSRLEPRAVVDAYFD